MWKDSQGNDGWSLEKGQDYSDKQCEKLQGRLLAFAEDMKADTKLIDEMLKIETKVLKEEDKKWEETAKVLHDAYHNSLESIATTSEKIDKVEAKFQDWVLNGLRLELTGVKFSLMKDE